MILPLITSWSPFEELSVKSPDWYQGLSLIFVTTFLADVVNFIISPSKVISLVFVLKI